MKKRIIFPICYALALAIFTLYIILDAFVIERTYIVVPDPTPETTDDSGTGDEPSDDPPAVITETSYEDQNIKINITTYRRHETQIYVADIVLSDISYLKTAFAKSTYGKNITDYTSVIAEQNNAILAIDGDYYSARNGYVIRNGILYRSTSSSKARDGLAIMSDGTFKIYKEGEISAKKLLEQGAVHAFSFGPALIVDSEVKVTPYDDVVQRLASNPRTAIGQIGDLHYVMITSDGRTSESAGLSLYQLANFMLELGVETAYNLDGGGSTSMYFNGRIVNKPTTDGTKIVERGVSDIVYIK